MTDGATAEVDSTMRRTRIGTSDVARVTSRGAPFSVTEKSAGRRLGTNVPFSSSVLTKMCCVVRCATIGGAKVRIAAAAAATMRVLSILGCSLSRTRSRPSRVRT